MFLTFAIELMGLQSLPIAVGVYLPISTSCADVRRRRGALAGRAAARAAPSGPSPRSSRARACCSPAGSIAGGALAGVAIAGIAAALVRRADAAQVPAADYLAHVVGLQRLLGRLRHQRPGGAGGVRRAWRAVLYRVAGR